MMISNVRGSFEKFSGTVNFNEMDPVKSSVDVKIDAASINTRDPQRDAHLRSPDFFDVEKYPYITFKSQRVEQTDENHGKIYGMLTIKGISKTVVLNVEYNGMAKSPWGTTSAGFTANTKINRKDWDLNWNKALETGGVLVGDEISINIELEIVQSQAEAVKEAEEEAAAAD
jgi:polyisoprenoid-binding protein YceI